MCRALGSVLRGRKQKEQKCVDYISRAVELYVCFWFLINTLVFKAGLNKGCKIRMIRTAFICSLPLPSSRLSAGVNLLVGTESGLMLLDRSGQGKVYPLINRRRIQQMDVLEGLNVLITISGTNRALSPERVDSIQSFNLHICRKKEQAASVLPVVAPKQNLAQRP